MSRIKAGSLVLIACKSGSHLNDGKTGTVLYSAGSCSACGNATWHVKANTGAFVFALFGRKITTLEAPFHDNDLIPIDPDESTEGEGSSRPVDREVTA